MPHYPNRQACWFRLFRFRSPLLTESLRFLFHGLLRCFSSAGSLLTPYVFRCGSPDITLTGFPHSEIRGSSLLCSSPRRFAAYASFFGNLSLGIRRTPFVACNFVAILGAFTRVPLIDMQLSKCSSSGRSVGHSPSAAKRNDTRSLSSCQAVSPTLREIAVAPPISFHERSLSGSRTPFNERAEFSVPAPRTYLGTGTRSLFRPTERMRATGRASSCSHPDRRSWPASPSPHTFEFRRRISPLSTPKSTEHDQCHRRRK